MAPSVAATEIYTGVSAQSQSLENNTIKAKAAKPRSVEAFENLPVKPVENKSLLNPASLAPPSKWIPKHHPRMEEVAREVDSYFIKHWGFKTKKHEQKFLDAGFSRVTCLYFPLARDDRIHFACQLLTILFIIDDILDHMSFEDGEAYNNQLMPIMRGDAQPNLTRPVEWIMYDMWEQMREHDLELANATLESTFTFMRAQTEKTRGNIRNLGEYLIYRERDVGKALLSDLMAFTMALHLTPAEKDLVRPYERNCAKQISVVNDICSYEKEVMAAKEGHEEGAALCSAVGILAGETDLSILASKRVLWAMAREWSDRHDSMLARMRASPNGCSTNVLDYLKGLEYQMSGNEEWSLSTLRYIDVPEWEDNDE